MRSRRLTLTSIVGVGLLIFVVTLAIFVFWYGDTHYNGVYLEISYAEYLVKEGQYIKAIVQYGRAVGKGLDAGIRWLAAEPFLQDMSFRAQNGAYEGALKSCKQALAFISTYDYTGDQRSTCDLLQERVDFELQCAQDCTSDPFCEFAPACAP